MLSGFFFVGIESPTTEAASASSDFEPNKRLFQKSQRFSDTAQIHAIMSVVRPARRSVDGAVRLRVWG
jgi:hypothetical protein